MAEQAEAPFQRYVKALEPLFQPSEGTGIDVDRLFQYVCCLVRAGGIEAAESDPILESTSLIDDMRALSELSLDPYCRRGTVCHPAARPCASWSTFLIVDRGLA
jgi:hypothetical protein